MATKPQVKNAIDNAAAGAKNEVDLILPAGMSIVDGSISFNPTHYSFTLDAVGSLADAKSGLAALKANLTAANRPFKVKGNRSRRDADPSQEDSKDVVVFSSLATYRIINIGDWSQEL